MASISSIDLSYAGLFGLRNVPDEALQPFLLIEAPRLLFPFARQIVADAVSEHGLPAAAARSDRLRGGLYGSAAGAAGTQASRSATAGRAGAAEA